MVILIRTGAPSCVAARSVVSRFRRVIVPGPIPEKRGLLMIRLRVPVWCAVLLLATAVLHAQVAGKVTGSVVDPTGAAVPEATVSLQLPGSGSSVFSTRTNTAGDFVMLAVPANTYDLVVES